jgi:hypothetical protein
MSKDRETLLNVTGKSSGDDQNRTSSYFNTYRCIH